jgi:hypothetical protein
VNPCRYKGKWHHGYQYEPSSFANPAPWPTPPSCNASSSVGQDKTGVSHKSVKVLNLCRKPAPSTPQPGQKSCVGVEFDCFDTEAIEAGIRGTKRGEPAK